MVSTSITVYYYGIAGVAYVVRKSLTRWSTTLDNKVTLVSKRSFSTIVIDFEQEMIWDTNSWIGTKPSSAEIYSTASIFSCKAEIIVLTLAEVISAEGDDTVTYCIFYIAITLP